MSRPRSAGPVVRALLGLFVVLAGSAPVPAAAAETALTLTSVLAGHPKVMTLDGKEIELSSLAASGAPTVVAFWATWCVPCREEAPHLADLSRQFQSKGLKVIGLSVDNPGRDGERVAKAVRQLEMTYAVAYAPIPTYRAFAGPGNQVSLPNVFVFDRAGNLVERFRGYDSNASPRELTKAVEKAVR